MFSIKSLKESYGWIILIIGAVCYVFGYVLIYNEASIVRVWSRVGFWAELIVDIGDILLVGGVVGYLSGIAQWKGLFVEELEKVMFGKQLLSKRNDLNTIWENVTKQMFKYKFMAIHRDILDALKHYLPDDGEISYYDNFSEDISVEWDNRARGIVHVRETLVFDIVAESTDEFEYSVKSTTFIPENIGAPEECIKHTVFIEENKIDTETTYEKDDSGVVTAQTLTKLSGKIRYKFKYIIDKKYCLYSDYHISYRNKRYIHNMRVSILLDDGIKAKFIDRGSFEGFREVKNTKNNIIMCYNGVVIPRQGFIFALNTY